MQPPRPMPSPPTRLRRRSSLHRHRSPPRRPVLCHRRCRRSLIAALPSPAATPPFHLRAAPPTPCGPAHCVSQPRHRHAARLPPCHGREAPPPRHCCAAPSPCYHCAALPPSWVHHPRHPRGPTTPTLAPPFPSPSCGPTTIVWSCPRHRRTAPLPVGPRSQPAPRHHDLAPPPPTTLAALRHYHRLPSCHCRR